jgi:hypothetical protein
VFVSALMPTELSVQPSNAGFSRLQTELGHYPGWQVLNPAATTPRLAPAPGNKKATADRQLQTASDGKGIEKPKA